MRVIAVDTESTLVDLGASKKVEAVVALGQLDQDDVEVQLLHGPVGANEELQPAAIVTMDLVGLDEAAPGGGGGDKNLHRYSGSFACEPAGRYGFTVRVVPSHDDLRTFAELGCVAWARADGASTSTDEFATQCGKWLMQTLRTVAEGVDFRGIWGALFGFQVPFPQGLGMAGDNRKPTSTAAIRRSVVEFRRFDGRATGTEAHDVMSADEQYIRPPSLRAYLDGGGDLAGFALLDSLVEAVVVARRLLPAETNRKQAARNRRFVERWFARHGGEDPVPATQELLTFAFWKAECLEDPALADRFEAALPADTLTRAMQLVDDLRHVHPLAVREEMANWTCRACGETFGFAPAAVVTNTGEELGYDDDLSYCLGCMSIATAALEAASGIDRFTEGLDDERHHLRPVGPDDRCPRRSRR